MPWLPRVLDLLDEGDNTSYVACCTTSGSVAFGYSQDFPGGAKKAVKWTGTTATALDVVVGGDNAVQVCVPGGSIVAGSADDTGASWTGTVGTDIGPLPLHFGSVTFADCVDSATTFDGWVGNGPKDISPPFLTYRNRGLIWLSGAAELAPLAGGYDVSVATATARNPMVPRTVGYSALGPSFEATIWETTAAVSLGFLPSGANSRAWAITADAGTIFGNSEDGDGNLHGVYWDDLYGINDLGWLPGGSYSDAFFATQDGATITGDARNSDGDFRGCYWRLGVITALPPLSGGTNSDAFRSSGDGLTFIGTSDDGSDNWNVVWPRGLGPYRLYPLAGQPASSARAVTLSADGTRIFGYANDGTYDRAVVWTFAGRPMSSLLGKSLP